MWGVIALVVVIAGVLVAVSQTTPKATAQKGGYFAPGPVPAAVLHEITHVPPSAFDAVGAGPAGAISLPKVQTGNPPLTSGGKPEVLYLSGDFCPYCAAERWAIITSLARFGTFSGLRTMESSPTDVYPRTQTFDLGAARYTSPFVTAKLLEVYGESPSGSHAALGVLSTQELGYVKAFDASAGGTRWGTIPFSDWGNELLFSGASFDPGALQGLSRATIAGALHDPTNPVTKLVLGTANEMSAAVCAIDGGKPGAVCASSGVRAAASALGVRIP